MATSSFFYNGSNAPEENPNTPNENTSSTENTVKTSFFYEGAAAPDQNTVSELLASLEEKLAAAQEAMNAAQLAATSAQASAQSASASEATTQSLLIQAQTALAAAQQAQVAAEAALAQANAAISQTADDVAAAEAAKVAAQAAQTLAETAATNAQTSATNAATSASTASTKASEASTSASNAASSATSAAGSATTATTKASEASASATAAAGSASTATTKASEASSSATAAASSASSASTSASTATTKASEASSSATAAAGSASNAASSATSASTSASNASTSASNAASSATSASNSATAASGSATSASNSASAASTSASNAATSEANALSYRNTAQSAATTATNASTAASAAQVAAETARDQTLAAYDNFDDRYLGAKTLDPTVDNDGNALIAGALYFNSSLGFMKVYTGSVWVDAYAAGSSFLAKANNLSDLADVATARTNLDVPTRTGGNASGTWGINITGNAATVTNGVYTNGSYADPAWINSLAGSKVSGNISGNASNVTGTVGIANGGTGSTSASAALVALGVQTSPTGSEIISTGTTAQRDASPLAGYFRFNTTTGQFEGYNGTAWGSVGGASALSALTDVTLTSPSAGQLLTYNGTRWVNGAPGTSTRVVSEFTATAGQTTFTPTGGYTVGFVDVFINGVQLQTSNFTASNGTTVVLSTGCQVGDAVSIIAWGVFSAASVNGANIVDGTVSDSKLANPKLNSTNPSYTGTLTGGTGVVNIGSGQFYKDASGNVGIGTSSPTNKLSVIGTGNTTPGYFYTPSGQCAVRIETAGNDKAVVEQYTNGNGNWRIGPGITTAGAFEVNSVTAGATRMLIDSSGNLAFNSGYGSVAIAYGCRAWVNFNGTGTVAIRASGNVSSITDNGTGDYTVNFTAAMPDTNYAVVLGRSSADVDNASGRMHIGIRGTATQLTTSTRLMSTWSGDGTAFDAPIITASIFR